MKERGNSKIQIIEKPEWISWDDIHELLLQAHKRNIEKGIVLKYAQMPGDWIREKLGDEGCCWVALDGDKPVGTTSVTYFQGKSWWNKGKKVAHGCFTGILREYQGTGLMEELNTKKYEHITGFRTEAWHYRYVGKDIAKIIYDNDLTLEEYWAMYVDQ